MGGGIDAVRVNAAALGQPIAIGIVGEGDDFVRLAVAVRVIAAGRACFKGMAYFLRLIEVV